VQQRAWLKQLEQVLATQTASHGGPIAFVEGRVLTIDAAAPPSPVTTISTTEAGAFARSREAINTARGALLWTDVEDAIYPAGWAANPSSLLRKGAVGLSGNEHPTTAALRRDAARGWARLSPIAHVFCLNRRKRQKPTASFGVNRQRIVSPTPRNRSATTSACSNHCKRRWSFPASVGRLHGS
jgi:hypothetical protein